MPLRGKLFENCHFSRNISCADFSVSSCQEGISGTSQSTPNFPTTISVFSVNFQFFSPHKFFVKFNEFKRVLMNFDVFWPNPSCGDFGGRVELWMRILGTVEIWGKRKN